MRTIGLIGGMSWESTQVYYQLINQGVKLQLGGLHSAKLVMVSVDFAEIAVLQQRGDWQASGEILANAAKRLTLAGADCIVICTNTMHKVAEQVASATHLPLLHIADATGLALNKAKISNVALLGTQFTMQQDFYKARLKDKFKVNVLVPDSQQQVIIHDIIYQQLCQGIVLQESKQAYLAIMSTLQQQGAEAVILGCTEIGLLVKQTDFELPLFDTTHLHANCAVNFSLQTD